MDISSPQVVLTQSQRLLNPAAVQAFQKTSSCPGDKAHKSSKKDYVRLSQGLAVAQPWEQRKGDSTGKWLGRTKGPATAPSHPGPQQELQMQKTNELFPPKSLLLGTLHGQRAQLHQKMGQSP